MYITNFMGHNLTIIVMWNLFFIGSYGIDMDVIHLLILFEHQNHAHCLDTNVTSLFVLFIHGCCMFIYVVYTLKLCTQLPCLNNAWHSCLNNTNLWNNKFHVDLEQTHEAYKFVNSGKVIKLNPNPLALCTTFILPWDLWPSKTNKRQLIKHIFLPQAWTKAIKCEICLSKRILII